MKKIIYSIIVACSIICFSSCEKKYYVDTFYIENATSNNIFIAQKSVDTIEQITFFRVEPYDRLSVSQVLYHENTVHHYRSFPISAEFILKIDGVDYIINDSTDIGSEILEYDNYEKNEKLYKWNDFYETYEKAFIFSITDEYVASLKK